MEAGTNSNTGPLFRGHTNKLILSESMESVGRPVRDFDDSLRTALQFLCQMTKIERDRVKYDRGLSGISRISHSQLQMIAIMPNGFWIKDLHTS